MNLIEFCENFDGEFTFQSYTKYNIHAKKKFSERVIRNENTITFHLHLEYFGKFKQISG